MHNRSLVIDGQVFQSDAWDRGMGKYSLSLLTALSKKWPEIYDQIYIVFNSTYKLSASAQKQLVKAVPKTAWLEMDLKVPKDIWMRDIQEAGTYNQEQLDKYISNHFSKDQYVDFLILALFTGHAYSVFPTNVRKVLIGYDLIPLLYSKRYSRHPNFTSYLHRYRILLQADNILTISSTVANDFVTYLGVGDEKVSSIGGGPIERVHIKSKRPGGLKGERFILMPTGDDLRKNNERAVIGFELYRKQKNDKGIRLVVTSNFTEKSQKKLCRYSDRIDFVGNVSEQELCWLYSNCQTVCFVPESEGLGLPILEGMEFKKPIVCSDISVFREISSQAVNLCDHLDPKSISMALSAADDSNAQAEKIKLYGGVLEQYSWESTVTKTINFLKKKIDPRSTNKLRKIAVFAPNPKGYSAIGKVVLQMQPALSDYFEVDYYLEDAVSGTGGRIDRPSYLDSVANVFSASCFSPSMYAKYDHVLYHIGNSEYHVDAIKNALYLPGTIIVHDTNLGGLFNGPLKGVGYVDQKRIKIEEQIDKLNKESETKYITSVANSQNTVIVHSEFAAALIKKVVSKDIPVVKANLPVGAPKSLIRRVVNGRLTVGLAGILSQVKGISQLLALVNADELSQCDFCIFGFSMLSEKEREKLNKYPNLKVFIDPTDFEFQEMLSKLDVLLNYRTEYKGETSLTVLEAMRHGVVPIVRDVGWYSELPDDCVVKVTRESDIKKQIKKLLDDNTMLNNKSQASYDYAKNMHSYEAYALALRTCVERVSESNFTNLNMAVAAAIKKQKSKEKILKIIKNY